MAGGKRKAEIYIFTLNYIIMRKIYIFFVFIVLSTASVAQTAASISNGNWFNPFTWNCTCVPYSGYSVTVNHSITLDGSLSFSVGGITVSNTGTLTQDANLNRDIWINGGYFNNNGKASFRYLLVSTGSISNNGTFTVSALTNSVNFSNNGSITMDSMYIAGGFTNTPNGKLIGDSLTNASTLINNGNINVTWVTNIGTFKNYNYQTGYAYTNAATYENYDSLILTGSVWNKAMFTNKPGAVFRMNKNFHNYHPSGTATFDNNGMVNVLDSWYNTDTVKGSSSGKFTVADTSANSGFMKGSYDFCDFTPPASSPKVDLNSGSISANITYCLGGVGIKEQNKNEAFIIYPNPNNGRFFAKATESDVLYITNQLGQQITIVELNEANNYTSEINNLAPGFYFVTGKNYKAKVVVSK